MLSMRWSMWWHVLIINFNILLKRRVPIIKLVCTARLVLHTTLFAAPGQSALGSDSGLLKYMIISTILAPHLHEFYTGGDRSGPPSQSY
jgi:hypothetical protein